ncbi:MAG: YeeE/YedE family protein [Burkholderiales bacterium]
MENPAQIVVLVVALGFALGLTFGAVAHKTNFCAMGAVSDLVNMGHWNRMRMWLLAIAVAVLGAGALAASGTVDLTRSFYTGARLTWLSHLVGGLLFGVGMTLASGCGSRNLVRLGGGNLKAFIVVLMLAATAYMTMKGGLAPLRVYVLDSVAVHLPAGQDLPRLLSAGFGSDLATMQWLLAALVSGTLVAFVAAGRDFRSDRDAWLGGVVVGATIVGGWYVSGHLGHLLEHPETLEEVYVATNSRRPESLTYVGPVAYTLELGLLWTDTSLKLTFGIATVLGTLAGSLLYAIATRNFRWEGFGSAADLRNHLLGGLLMGFGGVTAVGCTIGQGISGFSTLAIGSILTFAAIVAGAAATMKFLYWRMLREPASG